MLKDALTAEILANSKARRRRAKKIKVSQARGTAQSLLRFPYLGYSFAPRRSKFKRGDEVKRSV